MNRVCRMAAQRLVLASRSPQRIRLLRTMGLRFDVAAARVSERCTETNPRRLVAELARRKAQWVASKRPGRTVLGADTIVCSRSRICLKPNSRADALRILSLLNGRWHKVYTGVAVVRNGRVEQGVQVSRVKAKTLDPGALRRLAGKHMDKSGAYAVQDRKDPFIARIVGPRDNVIGLPRALVRRCLRGLHRETR